MARRLSWIAGLALIGAVAGLWWSGALAELSDREAITRLLTRLGPSGPLLFMAVVVALFPLFLIGPPIWSASAVWPASEAIAYSSIACLLASGIFYALARTLGRDWAQQRIPDNLRKYEERLVRHPLGTVLLLRLLLWANPAVDLLIGVSRVSTRDYLIGSVVGLIPVTAFHVMLVGRGFQSALALPPAAWLALAAVAGIAVWIHRARRRRKNAALAVLPESS